MLIAKLESTLRDFPKRPALHVQDHVYSYNELFGCAKFIAKEIEQKLEKNAVLVFSKKTFIGYSNILASFYTGKTYIPINPSFPVEKLKSIIHQSGSKNILIDESCLDECIQLLTAHDNPLNVFFVGHSNSFDQFTKTMPPFHRLNHIELSAENVALFESQQLTPIQTASKDSIAYIMFTSGSTGLPKGVPVSHENLVAYLDHIKKLYSFSEHDRHSQFFEFTFDLSMHDLMVCWTTGGCLFAANEFAKLMPVQFAEKHQLSVWFSVPSQITSARAIMKDKFDNLSLPALRHSLFCGEALPSSTVSTWRKIAPHSTIDNLYGPTEATIAFTLFRCTDSLNDEHNVQPVVPIGKPFEGNRILIVDDSLDPVRPGEVGELCLLGPQVVNEYWNDLNNTLKSFFRIQQSKTKMSSVYRTGDRVHQDQYGILHFHGRQDHQIKIRGYRIELQEIEFRIRECTGAGHVAVIPFPLGENNEAQGLVAFYSQCKISKSKIIENCQNHLPDYMVPDQIHELSELPLNSNGKIDRTALSNKVEKV
ncbi:AMP-binding protein [Pleionea sediminis]|uniref:AMP-binding protein n=1 Tax=Pleionea sediminis TaxID=2569479 RepID=UPI0011854574|nr:AMP-binding protein [Pleionea sediminis]